MHITTQNPSAVSSGGAVGKQFNPDGAIGQVGEKIGGPFSKDGAIGMFYRVVEITSCDHNTDQDLLQAPNSTPQRTVLPVRSRRLLTAPAARLPRRSEA